METTLLFPFSEYWWVYVAFNVFVCLMLALDLGVFHKKAHVVKVREAAVWSAVWVLLALAFNFVLYLYSVDKFGQEVGTRVGMEFLTGYVVEKSLAVDNIFVFVMVFAALGIPAIYQHRVLFFGILGALAFRAAFIALGSQIMAYHWVMVVFGVFLVFTGVKMLFMGPSEVHPENSRAISIMKRFLPITPRLEGQKFFTRVNGVLHATPLFVALLFLEVTDVIFAVDSVPAIFAITKEPMLVFTSNILAILGLRSMYFLLAGVIDRFIYLKYGLALVLVFVGLKMAWLNDLMGGKFPIGLSLGIITGLIGSSIAVSLFVTRRKGGKGPGKALEGDAAERSA